MPTLDDDIYADSPGARAASGLAIQNAQDPFNISEQPPPTPYTGFFSNSPEAMAAQAAAWGDGVKGREEDGKLEPINTDNIGANFTAQFTQGQRYVGVDSRNIDDWTDATVALKNAGFKAPELDKWGSSMLYGQDRARLPAELIYSKYANEIEAFAKANPSLNIKTQQQLLDAETIRLKADAKQAQDINDNAGTLGKIAGLAGSIFGAATHPLNIALMAAPTGLAASAGASIKALLPQVPRIIGLATSVAGISAGLTESDSLDYRSRVLGEDISNLNIAGDIAKQAAIGGLFGGTLVAGGAAVGRVLSRGPVTEAAKQLGDLPSLRMLSADNFTPEMQSTLNTLRAAPELNEAQTSTLQSLERLKAINDGTHSVNLDENNPYSPDLKSQYEQLQALHESGIELSPEMDRTRQMLGQIDDVMSFKPEGVDQVDHLRDYVNARAKIETPPENDLYDHVPQNDSFKQDNVIEHNSEDFMKSQVIDENYINSLPEDIILNDGSSAKETLLGYNKESAAMDDLISCMNNPKPRI